jgi:hypothetical protein
MNLPEIEVNQAQTVLTNTLIKLIEDCTTYKEITNSTLELLQETNKRVNTLTQALQYTQEALSITSSLVKEMVEERAAERGDRK